MSNEKAILCNDFLDVTVRLPGEKPVSGRFDDAGVVEQVVLHGKHRFCQPEQVLKNRWTSGGVGLCCEFEWPEFASNVLPGERFPKLGVGLLTQCSEGGDYKFWQDYAVEPFETTYSVFEGRVEFVQHPKPCMDVAVRVFKTVQLYANTVTVSTTLENLGERALELFEYQHNFVAIDDLPIGPGYRLELPYEGDIAAIKSSAFSSQDMFNPTPVSDVFEFDGKTIRWKKFLDGIMYRKETLGEKIATLPLYRWTISHDKSPARISETSHFTPVRLVLWGIEHTLSVEVYNKIHVLPSGRQTFARTWCFEDEQTQRF